MTTKLASPSKPVSFKQAQDSRQQKADTEGQAADVPVRSHAATVRRLEIILSKEVDRRFEALGQLYLWLPSEFCFRQRNIWPALFGVVLG
jgi:hypothetical protein